MKFNENRPLYKLKEIASILRGNHGCAWDKDQTSQSLKPYLLEETYEAYEAIENGSPDNIKEELGDLLYQIFAHSQLAEEDNSFTIDDVAQGIIDKLVRRHPHVFGDEAVHDKWEVLKKWEKIKKDEKPHRQSILDGVPISLPALLKAYRVQQKVSRVGFDWNDINNVIEKLDEEVMEFKEAFNHNNKEKATEEIGDILFTIANISRFSGINPEEALVVSVNKFIKRFKFIEKEVSESGKDMDEMSLEELDEIWEQSKDAVEG